MNSAIENLDRTQARFRDRLQGVNEYMRYRKLPETTRTRVREYYERIWYLNQGLDETAIIEDLPRDLRTEVATFVHQTLLQKVPLFRDAGDAFIRALALRIKPELCLPGDFIFRQGERGAEMYFLSRGKVEVIGGDGVTILTVLGEGSYFGEIAILTNATRTASVRAKESCELFVLQKKDFDSLLEQYPAVAEKISQVAQEREKNKGAPQGGTKAMSNVVSAYKGMKQFRLALQRQRRRSLSTQEDDIPEEEPSDGEKQPNEQPKAPEAPEPIIEERPEELESPETSPRGEKE
eukprot:TRINITY_DN2294_c0_g1_i1.p1 TRINITY_DN2294_c0_g1~~TRINITY_DN2294_c0_g1_i1.p1  ORF type:complete len:293 (-),score=40.41 TRINITY_DN2294_c0_g1_i1:447-1325(-)